MTAPALSGAEQAEVDRFGVHDEDVLRDLAEHADDEPACVYVTRGIPCGHLATFAVLCIECGRQCGIVCGPHAAVVSASVRPSVHGACDAHGPLRDLIRLVPL